MHRKSFHFLRFEAEDRVEDGRVEDVHDVAVDIGLVDDEHIGGNGYIAHDGSQKMVVGEPVVLGGFRYQHCRTDEQARGQGVQCAQRPQEPRVQGAKESQKYACVEAYLD